MASATAVLLALICVTGGVGWSAVSTSTTTGLDAQGRVVEQTSISIPPWIIGAVLDGLVLVIATFFKPAWSPGYRPPLRGGRGPVRGGHLQGHEARYEGIVLQAVALTIGVFAVMLVLYATGRIRVTARFRLVVMAATGAVALIYLATVVMRLFGAEVPFVHDNGIMGIGFSLVVVVIAALNLALDFDFDFVDRAERAGAPRHMEPRHMEWFAALGLVVTLVWLYLELLRLLGKLRSR